MQVFWCEECEVPVLYAANKSKEKAEDNPYLDIEDELLEWVGDNQASYRRFCSLKKKIDSKLDNKKSVEHIKEEIRKNYQNYELEIQKYAFRYLDIKVYENNDKKLKYYKCPKCNSKAHYISKDIRPVFMKERVMLSVLLEQDLTEENIWNGAGNNYIINGEGNKIAISDLYKVDNLEKKINRIQDKVKEIDREVDFSNFIKVNKEHFEYIDTYAIDFIERVSLFFIDKFKIVSFSGGKDSTVISDLVTRALDTQDILHIFGDTNLEFSFTYDYLERLKERLIRPPFLPVDTPNDLGDDESKHQYFMELANKFGPPSRVMRWCCTIFKTGPIGKLFREISGEQGILTFYGVRRSESAGRSTYDKISKSPKISKQIVVSPIIDWHDADVWLYLLTREIDFNDAYRLGFARVGCWCCPNNSKWSEFLCRIFMEDKAKEWRKFLVGFAKKIGKPDPEVYIDNGKWKARQGGAGLNRGESELEIDLCGDFENNIKHYNLKREISEEFYEFFKPFGIISRGIHDQEPVNVMDSKKSTGSKEDRIKFQLKISRNNRLTVEVKNKELLDNNNAYQFFQRVECQLRKYQFCEYCSACANICPQDAISLIDGYIIDEDKCVHCLECIAHFDRGCLIAKAMKVKAYK